jgi:hypothetical protein
MEKEFASKIFLQQQQTKKKRSRRNSKVASTGKQICFAFVSVI